MRVKKILGRKTKKWARNRLFQAEQIEESLFLAWKASFVSHKSWNDHDPNAIADERANRRRRSRSTALFQRELRALAEKHGCSQGIEHYETGEPRISISPGDLGPDIADGINSLLNKSEYFCDFLGRTLRPGPARIIPPFVAEYIVIGIELLIPSEIGLELLKSYFAPRGEFYNWYLSRFSNPRLAEQICLNRSGETAGGWVSQFRQTLERILLSAEDKKVEKSSSRYTRSALLAARVQIFTEAAVLARSVGAIEHALCIEERALLMRTKEERERPRPNLDDVAPFFD